MLRATNQITIHAATASGYDASHAKNSIGNLHDWRRNARSLTTLSRILSLFSDAKPPLDPFKPMYTADLFVDATRGQTNQAGTHKQ